MMKLMNEKRGFAILAVVFILIAFAILGMAAVSLISGSAGMLVDEVKTQQAFDLATAGISYEAEQLEADADWSDNTGYTKTFGPGSFTISYVAQTSTTATVRSDGTVGGITRSVQQEFEAGAGGGPKAFQSAAYTEQEIDVSGTASGSISGEVSAGGAIDDEGSVTFNDPVEENNTEADVPEPIWSFWLAIADHVEPSNHTFQPGTYTGVWYIDGNVTVKSNVVINGTIVARGKVTINGQSNITITAQSPYPAIIAEDKITLNGNVSLVIYGIVVCMDDITLTGNQDFVGEGGLVAVGDIVITGDTTIDLTYNEDYAASGAGFTGGEPGGEGLGQSNWIEVY